jgi:hypothetical protein
MLIQAIRMKKNISAYSKKIKDPHSVNDIGVDEYQDKKNISAMQGKYRGVSQSKTGPPRLVSVGENKSVSSKNKSNSLGKIC